MEYASPADYQVRTEGGVDDLHDGNVMDRLPKWARFLSWLFVLPGIIMSLWPLESGGLAPHETERVAEAITGKDYTTDYFSPLDQLRDMKKDGDYEGEGVIVGMQWNDGGHALQLEKIIDDPNDPPPRAVLHNPWGSNPGAKKGDQVPGAPPGVVWEDPEKGLVAWPLDDFEENLKYCFYPSDLDD